MGRDAVMQLPAELKDGPDTDVVGDVDALIDYVESGQAAHDWDKRMAVQAEELVCWSWSYET
jgi:hypothetical protein